MPDGVLPSVLLRNLISTLKENEEEDGIDDRESERGREGEGRQEKEK